MIRTASATWNGNFNDGSGTISTESGAFDNQAFGVSDRFGEGTSTNPEEIVGAAHAACFSMALSLFLQNGGVTPKKIATTCEVKFEKVGDAWTITESHLKTALSYEGGTEEQVRSIAEEAKKNCPISRLLNTKIVLTLTLD